MLGTIEALENQAVKKGDWVVVIRPGHPLFQPDGPDFKGWIWKKMQECRLELFDLYMIQNGAWVGAQVKVVGPNSVFIAAAARYILSHHEEYRQQLIDAGITPIL